LGFDEGKDSKDFRKDFTREMKEGSGPFRIL
jgi:hypothetical protein